MTSEERICLLLRPFAGLDPRIRVETDRVREEIIQPALKTKDTSFRVEVIEAMATAGSISDKIIETLFSAYLVIADLTHITPSIMFHMGYRLALNLTVIAIVREDEFDKLPFDVRTMNVIAYSLSTKHARTSAIARIRRQIKTILRGEEQNTVFYRNLKDVGKKLAMRSVYRSFEDSLRHTLDCIRTSRWDLCEEMDFDIIKLEEHYRFSRQVFRTLSDKLYIFTQIASGASLEYTDSQLLRLTALAAEVLEVGDSISRYLSEAIKGTMMKTDRSKTHVVRSCLSELGRMLSKAEKVLEKALIETQKQGQPHEQVERAVDFSKVREFLEAHGYQLAHISGLFRVFTKESASLFLVPTRGGKVSEDYFRLLRKKVKDANYHV